MGRRVVAQSAWRGVVTINLRIVSPPPGSTEGSAALHPRSLLVFVTAWLNARKRFERHRERCMKGRSKMRNSSLALAAVVVAGLAGGCGLSQDGPETSPVSGVVKYKGKPLDHGRMVFIDDETGKGAY